MTDPSTGGHQRVVAVYPQRPRRIYRVTCDDGAWTDVGGEHLWAYRLANHHRPGTKESAQRTFAAEALGAECPAARWDTLKVGDTDEMRAALEAGHSPRLPLTEPVLFTVNGNTCTGPDPYVLGLLLGDGALPNCVVTACEDEIRDALRVAGFRAHSALHTDGKPKSFGVAGAAGKRFRQWLYNHGLHTARSWEKFIPDYVFTASIPYRLAFLQGLMDTDGTADDRGRCYFTSTSRALAEGVQALVRSLGGKARLRERAPTYEYGGERRNGRLAYQVRVWMRRTSAFFRLERKRARCTDRWNGGAELSREVVSIEYVGEQAAVCIRVSGPRGLYVTRDYIVTHNTEGMLGEWISHAELYGPDAIGLMVRRERTQLIETIERSKAIYALIGAKFNEQDKLWRFRNGARLRFAYLERDADADAYQGHSYTRVYVEEIGNFPSPGPIMKLMATLRSGAGVPVGFRATGNPGGPGHHWVRARYIDPAPQGWKIITEEFRNPWTGEAVTRDRVYIPARLTDNRYLGPEYVANLQMSGSPELVRAWLEGDWTVISGAFFPEFSAARHIVSPMPLPEHWTRFRACDWGSAKPFSVGWYAVSDGCLPQFARGCLVKYREWYGMQPGQPNVGLKLTAEEVGAGVAQRERGEVIEYGVMDPSTFREDGGPSIAERMYLGSGRAASWRPADNTRVAQKGAMGGWDQLRARLKGDEEGRPMIVFFATCTDTIRTLPALQHDPARAEDVDTSSEDHAPDETRYACMSRPYMRNAPKPKPEGPSAMTFDQFLKLTSDEKPRSRYRR